MHMIAITPSIYTSLVLDFLSVATTICVLVELQLTWLWMFKVGLNSNAIAFSMNPMPGLRGGSAEVASGVANCLRIDNGADVADCWG